MHALKKLISDKGKVVTLKYPKLLEEFKASSDFVSHLVWFDFPLTCKGKMNEKKISIWGHPQPSASYIADLPTWEYNTCVS